MDLYIAEKPSLAKTLVGHLSKGQKTEVKKGYITGPGWVMTWCLGHLYELYDANEYKPEWGSPWKIQNLPILPESFKYRAIERSSGQLAIVHSLINKANRVYNSCDGDSEGQLIFDLVMKHSQFTGDTFRVWPDDLSPIGLEKVFSKIKPNIEYRPLSLSAQARSQADWLVGINFTRLYTCLAEEKGFQGTLTLGRVQTVAFALIYNRCIEIENFIPLPHFALNVEFKTKNGNYTGSWVIPDELTNEQGYCINRQKVESIKSSINNQTGIVKNVTVENKTDSAPLPFSLSKLQIFCSKKWGYTAKEVLNGCQFLYEDLKVVTYPRTDCEYLSEGDFKEAQNIASIVISALGLYNTELSLSFKTKPRCFNNTKTTAHTGIIPTNYKPDFSNLESLLKKSSKTKGTPNSSVIKNIYAAVALRFIAQFMPKHEYQATTVLTGLQGYKFKTTGRIIINPGWKSLLSDSDSNSKENITKLPSVIKGEMVSVFSSEVLDRKTKPSEYFTEGSLIAALASISKYVEDPKIKQRLKDTDGIGTEATRADIIEKIKKIGYVKPLENKLLLTSLGRDIFPSIPPFFKTPAMTAIWESALQGIAESRLDHNAFNKNIVSWTETQITKLKESPPELNIKIDDKYLCEKCDKPLVEKKGQYGKFWACSDRACKSTYKDFKHAPLYPIKGDGTACPQCKDNNREGVMITRVMKENREKGKPAQVFLGCNQFPACNNSEWTK